MSFVRQQIAALNAQSCDWRFNWLAMLMLTGLISVSQPGIAAEPASDAVLAGAVRLPPGFTFTRFAGDQQAHDLHALTFNARGELVVAGPGFIRILRDENGDGVAETSTLFAETPVSGAQGLWADATTVLAVGDGGVWRFEDRDQDRRADGPPTKVLALNGVGEHGIHALQRGHDGWWYLIGGDATPFANSLRILPTSPIREPRQGALIRVTPDFRAAEVLLDGLRNAYDFTATATGDYVVYDSDQERDISLPWYRPARVFQAVPGMNAGWVSKSCSKPRGLLDVAPVLADLGRGSPTGVCCYQHQLFPADYHGAVFLLDWTHGRIHVLRREAIERAAGEEAELFLSATGHFGFAPVDAEVGPDGALYVAVGGRGTQGAVYRIGFDHVTVPAQSPAPAVASNDERPSSTELTAVLTATQFASCWSQATWVPRARALGATAFLQAVQDRSLSSDSRGRAIEILAEVFDGVPTTLAKALIGDDSAEVRVQVVRNTLASSRRQRPGQVLDAAVGIAVLLPALRDQDPRVQRQALAALPQFAENIPATQLVAALEPILASGPPMHRFLAAQWLARSPSTLALIERKVRPTSATALPQSTLELTALSTVALAKALARRGVQGATVAEDWEWLAPASLASSAITSPDERRQALRVLQLVGGEYGPRSDRPAAFDSYALGSHAAPLRNDQLKRQLSDRLLQAARFDASGEVLPEALRTAALLALAARDVEPLVLQQLTRESDPVDDLHLLVVLTQLGDPLLADATPRQTVATTIVQLDAKIAEHQYALDTNWNDRVREILQALLRRQPLLAEAIANHAEFGRSAHALLWQILPASIQPSARAAIARQAESVAEFAWTPEVIRLLATPPDPRYRDLIRRQVDQFKLRSAALSVLAQTPDAADRELYLDGLLLPQLDVALACLTALEQLPPSDTAREQLTLVRAARAWTQDDREYAARERAFLLLQRNTGQRFPFVAGRPGYQPQPAVVDAWSRWCEQRWPNEARVLTGPIDPETDRLLALVPGLDLRTGDKTRGGRLFETRGCAQCHRGRLALGPDLAGLTRRFAPQDVFTAILLPSRDVPNRYQTTLVETNDGRQLAGLVIYESTDSLLLRNATLETLRVAPAEIADRRVSPISLMPSGLLKDLTSRDLADLYQYLDALAPGTP